MEKPYAIIDKTTNLVSNIIILNDDNVNSFSDENSYLVEASPSTSIGMEYDQNTNKFVGAEEDDEIFYLNEQIELLKQEIKFIYEREPVPTNVDPEELVKFFDYYAELGSILSDSDLQSKKTRLNELVKPDYSIIENAWKNELNASVGIAST